MGDPVEQIDLEQLMREALELEPFPQAGIRLAGLSARGGVEVRDVVEVVSLDPVLTGAVLRQANSASSSPLHGISDVRQATVRLGIESVIRLGISAAFQDRLRRAGVGAEEQTLWRHSVAASLAASHLRDRALQPVAADVVVSALLHDVGKLVLLQHAASAKVVEPPVVADGAPPPLLADEDSLYQHHAELGEVIARHWKLPASIAEAIRDHHGPPVGARPASWCVFLAEEVASRITGEPRHLDDDALLQHAVDQLDLAPEEFGLIVSQVEHELDDVITKFA